MMFDQLQQGKQKDNSTRLVAFYLWLRIIERLQPVGMQPSASKIVSQPVGGRKRRPQLRAQHQLQQGRQAHGIKDLDKARAGWQKMIQRHPKWNLMRKLHVTPGSFLKVNRSTIYLYTSSIYLIFTIFYYHLLYQKQKCPLLPKKKLILCLEESCEVGLRKDLSGTKWRWECHWLSLNRHVQPKLLGACFFHLKNMKVKFALSSPISKVG